jgi:hypothetical protein
MIEVSGYGPDPLDPSDPSIKGLHLPESNLAAFSDMSPHYGQINVVMLMWAALPILLMPMWW